MTSAFAPDGFYPFEGSSTISLELIPLSVRHKLDCSEVKLHLTQWQALSIDERALLVQQGCGDLDEVRRYRDLLNQMIDKHHGVPPTSHPLTGDEPWRDVTRWPEVVVDQCGKQQLELPEVEQWRSLGEADRHALFVLGRSKHSQGEFVGAMKLFFGV